MLEAGYAETNGVRLAGTGVPDVGYADANEVPLAGTGPVPDVGYADANEVPLEDGVPDVGYAEATKTPLVSAGANGDSGGGDNDGQGVLGENSRSVLRTDGYFEHEANSMRNSSGHVKPLL